MLRAASRSIDSMRTPRTQRNGPGRGGVGATESTIACVAFISRVNIWLCQGKPHFIIFNYEYDCETLVLNFPSAKISSFASFQSYFASFTRAASTSATKYLVSVKGGVIQSAR